MNEANEWHDLVRVGNYATREEAESAAKEPRLLDMLRHSIRSVLARKISEGYEMLGLINWGKAEVGSMEVSTTPHFYIQMRATTHLRKAGEEL